MASNPHNPAMSPHSWTSRHPSDCDKSGKRGKKKEEVVGGINAENNRLKKAKAAQRSSQRGSK